MEDRNEYEVKNWDEDDDLKKQVKKVEEKFTLKEVGGGFWQQEALQKVRELVASHQFSEGKEVQGKEGVRKVVGWSINEMDEN